MSTSRLLFVRPRLDASLAPIYAALMSLVALGLLAFAFALWPEGSAPSASRPEAGGVAPASGSARSGASPSQKMRLAPGRGRWA